MTEPREFLVTVALTSEEVELLGGLARGWVYGGEGETPELAASRWALHHLVQSAIDGARRPGSWERGWLRQAFGGQWTGPVERRGDVETPGAPEKKVPRAPERKVGDPAAPSPPIVAHLTLDLTVEETFAIDFAIRAGMIATMEGERAAMHPHLRSLFDKVLEAISPGPAEPVPGGPR